MEEVLYIWAKEYSDFKYQQGMNEILAVILICLVSELIFNQDSRRESSDEEEQTTDEVHEAYMTIHDPKYIWADAYALFERLMNLGVKELYYKEIKATPEETKEPIKEEDPLKLLTQVVLPSA